MALPLYLAMTPAEIAHCPPPQRMAYMACHFSSYGAGLSNFPTSLPDGSMLILNDRIPVWNHDPSFIADQLVQAVDGLKPEAVLLDFQIPEQGQTAAIVKAVTESLSCPTGVTEHYISGSKNCAVFLPPPPLHVTPENYFAPWQGHEIWLEAAMETQRFIITEESSQAHILPYELPQEPRHFDSRFPCTYHIDVKDDRVVFTLSRTPEDLKVLLDLAENCGITRAVGLYQQLWDCFTDNAKPRRPKSAGLKHNAKRDINRTFSCSYGQLQTSAYASGWG